MARKRTLFLIFSAGIILLLTGLGSSYYWLTRIYLPKQIDANENASKLMEWTKNDDFIPPADGRINEAKLILFIQMNESLSFMFKKLRRQFEEHSWRLAFDIIKMQPEWGGNKYLALKKFNLSPREYDWMVNLAIEFWIYRWKEYSIERLHELGWKLENFTPNPKKKPLNYELLLKYEDDINKIFDILWPKEPINDRFVIDSNLNRTIYP